MSLQRKFSITPEEAFLFLKKINYLISEVLGAVSDSEDGNNEDAGNP